MDLSLEFISILLSIPCSLLIWLLNEKTKRKEEERILKIQHYNRLIENIEGFYEDSKNTDKKNKFLEQYRFSWIYCPDDVVVALNKFFESVKTGNELDENERKESFQNLFFCIRKDLMLPCLFRDLTKFTTKITPKDFEIYKAN